MVILYAESELKSCTIQTSPQLQKKPTSSCQDKSMESHSWIVIPHCNKSLLTEKKIIFVQYNHIIVDKASTITAACTNGQYSSELRETFTTPNFFSDE